MIRERRDEDLARLEIVVHDLQQASRLPTGQDPARWLTEHDAARSWVFDMAPVTVTPTNNVVGHVQAYAPDDSCAPSMVEAFGGRPQDVLVIGRLFVRRDTHEQGIGRFLLRESVRYVRSRGRVPVIHPRDLGSFPTRFYRRFGFEDAPGGEPGLSVMVCAGARPLPPPYGQERIGGTWR